MSDVSGAASAAPQIHHRAATRYRGLSTFRLRLLFSPDRSLFGSLVDCEPHGQFTPICRIGAIRLHAGHALVVVTGNPVTWPHIAQLRRLGSAAFLGIMAA